MHFFKQFYNKNLKYELINKFIYKKPNELAKLEKIILNYGCNSTDLKSIATGLLALELITAQRGAFTVSKKSNISLKIRKGNPVGCKVTVRKSRMFFFLSKIIENVLPNLKNFEGLSSTKNGKTYSFKIQDNYSFMELEKRYYFFTNLPNLNITLVFTSKKKEERVFMLKEFQLPLK